MQKVAAGEGGSREFLRLLEAETRGGGAAGLRGAEEGASAGFSQTMNSVEKLLGEGGAEAARKKAAMRAVSPEARKAAEKIVSQLFFLPVVESMRDFPFGKGVGYGGRTEDAFGQQLDVRIADVMAGADRSGLVEKMARKFEARR